jgi:hypothetical protein
VSLCRLRSPELVDAGQRSNDAVITLCYNETKEDSHGYF